MLNFKKKGYFLFNEDIFNIFINKLIYFVFNLRESKIKNCSTIINHKLKKESPIIKHH